MPPKKTKKFEIVVTPNDFPAQLRRARANVKRTRIEAENAKAEYKRAKKIHKHAKKAAKRAREALEELTLKVKQTQAARKTGTKAEAAGLQESGGRAGARRSQSG